ncbi:MAG TPA: ribonuclease HII, partial [Nocardioides sp.]|nr:ribonuclease HII [Nocardioides sp.]
VAACIAAASVLAKLTRDRIIADLDARWPAYDFKTHKGYITEVHTAALLEHGPSPEHRMRFVNVRRAAGLEPCPGEEPTRVDPDAGDGPDQVDEPQEDR